MNINILRSIFVSIPQPSERTVLIYTDLPDSSARRREPIYLGRVIN